MARLKLYIAIVCANNQSGTCRHSTSTPMLFTVIACKSSGDCS